MRGDCWWYRLPILLFVWGGVNAPLAAQVSAPTTATIKIHRQGLMGALGAYVVAYVNGVKLGPVDTESPISFSYTPNENGVNELQFIAKWWQGDVHVNETFQFVGTPGGIIKVTARFASGWTSNKLETQFQPEQQGGRAASGEDPSEIVNNLAYQYLMSPQCADPGWFKASINREKARKFPKANELQLAKPTLRLLALSVFFLPVVIIALGSADEWRKNPQEMILGAAVFISVLAGGIFIVGWIAQFLLNLAWFAGTGNETGFSYSFSLFCTVLLLLAAITALTVHPVLQAVRLGLPSTRFLGYVCIALEGFGILFTLRDIAGLFFVK